MSYSSSLQTVTSATVYGTPFLCPGSRAVQLTIANAACILQIGRGIGTPMWGQESYRLPGVHTIPGPIDAIRLRAASPIVTGFQPRWSADAY